MSVQAMTWALEQRLVMDASARHVLLCLANYADKAGRAAFPSAASLSDDTGLSLRTIRYKLEQLAEAGAIRPGNQAIAAAYIDRHDRRPVVYDLAMERGATDAGRAERGATDDRTGCNPCTNGVQLTTERGATVAPNPSFNHPLTINDPKEQGASAPVKPAKFDPLTARPSNVSQDTWAEWCQYRREIRKALTATSIRNQAAALAGHPNPDAVLRQSIANGWTGIFPEKITHETSSGHRAAGRPSAVDSVKQAIAAREAAAGVAGQPVDQDDRDVRAPLDGEFRRVG